ncbi:MAG: glycosyltransferase family 2 protein, partial [Treponema sp.]|nr:glycosyltransferase family 2 protein [Candidatus Treponema merdequi]
MKQVDFTLIIPCYNNANSLDEFFSLLNKIDYHSFEVIFVNDGSTDNTIDVLTELSAKADFPVQIASQKNAGPGAARNKGLKFAKGKYIWFIDSDDCFCPDSLKKLKQVLSNIKTDILNFNYKIIHDKKDSEFSGTDKICTEHNRYAILFEPSCPWAKIYNRKFLIDNKIQFPDCYFAEDLVFNVRAYSNAKNIYHFDYTLYNYFVRQDSVSATWKNNHIKDFLQIVKLLLKESELHELYREEICFITCRHVETLLNSTDPVKYGKEIQEIQQYVNKSRINENTYECIKNREISKYENSLRWRITKP